MAEVAGSEKFAVSFEPDVNTDAEFVEPLPQERIAALVRELVDLVNELVKEGDKPWRRDLDPASALRQRNSILRRLAQ